MTKKITPKIEKEIVVKAQVKKIKKNEKIKNGNNLKKLTKKITPKIEKGIIVKAQVKKIVEKNEKIKNGNNLKKLTKKLTPKIEKEIVVKAQVKKIVEKNEKIKNSNTLNKQNKKIHILKFNKQHIQKCVDIVTKKNETKTLFYQNQIFLQIVGHKIPKTPRRTIRLYLPHSLVGENDEVALFVPDLIRGIRQDYENSVEHWETVLREKNVTSIKEVIPMNRVKTEYRQHESKLKLGRLFDYFLVDGRITGHLTHLLGQNFLKVGRKPIPVKLSRDNLKEEINNALKKTNLEIHGLGNTHTIEVASTTMKNTDIVDNVIAAFEEITKKYPGGLKNIKSIFIKTKNSKSIPIYYSLVNKNKIAVPEIKPLRPKSSTSAEK